jgi:hypothetical protein
MSSLTTQFKKWLTPLVWLSASLWFFAYTDILFWVPCLALAIFFFAINVLNMGKSESRNSEAREDSASFELGVLGHYTVDQTKTYGLFLPLKGRNVLIDIREDKLIDERKEFAQYLFDNRDKLEKSLDEFIESNPEFLARQIDSIGLHSEALDQGEVFWDPDGYTGLRGLVFFV